MKIIILIFFISLSSVILINNVDTPTYKTIDQFFQIMSECKYEDDYYNGLVDAVIEGLDYYFFAETAKVPPQAYHNYLKGVDLKEELSKLKNHKGNFYEFYQKFEEVICMPKDYHYLYRFTDKVNDSNPIGHTQFQPPIQFKTTKKDGEFILYAVPNKNIKEEIFQELYSENVVETINNNTDVPIKSINDLPPFEFLNQFGKRFSNIKNRHGHYNYIYNNFGSFPANVFPFGEEELKNLKIVYQNGDSFSADFYAYIDESNSVNSNSIYSPFIRHSNSDSSVWTYSVSEGDRLLYGCKIDEKEQVNIYYQIQFGGNFDDIYAFYRNCSLLFDKNKFPIIVIEDFNGGGDDEIDTWALETLFYKHQAKFYSSAKYNDKLPKDLSEDYFSKHFKDIKTCKPYESIDSYFKLGSITDMYRDGVILNRTKLALIMDTGVRKELNEFKKELNNLRKPTEIIVFTDGYSESATSIFIKNLQLFGHAIIVGYHQNPLETFENFDASNNPTGQVGQNPEYQNKMRSYGFGSYCTPHITFYPKNTEDEGEISMEYTKGIVDEIAEIYDRYDDEILEQFVKEGKRIFNKYKNNCNNNNLALKSLDDKCDAILNKKHMHGGFLCSPTGIWSTTKCGPIYCDDGYYLDYEKQTCLKDPCVEGGEDDDNISFVKVGMLILIFVMLL